MIALLCSLHPEWQPKAMRAIWNNKQEFNRVRVLGSRFVFGNLGEIYWKPLLCVMANIVFRLFTPTWGSFSYRGVVAELVSSSITVPSTASSSYQSPLCFFAGSGAFASCHSTPTPGVDSCKSRPTLFPVTCSMGLHWSPLTTLKRWPRRWNGAPAVMTVNLSVHPSACSPVSLFLPFGNHSTWFGQLPHVHSSFRRCLNSSSSHLSRDGLKGMLQPPPGPSTVIRCFEFCWQPIKKLYPLILCLYV